MKLKYMELMEISQSLDILGGQEIDEWYEVGRNITKCKPLIDEYKDMAETLDEKLAEKDDNGNIKRTISPDGKAVFTSYGKNKGKSKEAYKKLNEEDVEIDFHEIPLEKFKNPKDERAEKGEWKYKLKGTVMAPLLDTVILNGEAKEKKK